MPDPSTSTAEIKSPRRKLFFAITGTNAIGMPALLLYIFAVIGVLKPWSYISADLKLDPLFVPTTFTMLISVSLAFVFIHFFHVIKLIAPVEEFLALDAKTGAKQRKETAREALRASEWFPYHTFYWSIVYYIAGTPLALLLMNLPYMFSWRQNLSLLFGIWVTGVLISVFQFYTSRRALAELQVQILDEFPDLLLEDQDRKRSGLEAGLKPKFMFAIVVLAVMMVVLTSAVAVNIAVRSLQIQTGEFYLSQISQRAAEIEIKINTTTGPNELFQLIQGLALGPQDIVISFDEEQKHFFETELDQRFVRLAQLILGQNSWKFLSRDPVVLTLRNNVYSAIMGLNHHYVVVHIPLSIKAGAPGDRARQADILVFIPDSRYSDAVRGMDFMVFFVLVIGIGLALYYSKLSSEEMRDPLRSLMNTLKAMAAGDLTKNVGVTSRDELGVVARSLALAIFNLRRLISKVDHAVSALDHATAAIAAQADEVAVGSTTQVHEVDETSMAMEEMRTSVSGIAESVQTLASSTEESSASIIQVQATIEHVAGNVENLSSTVLQTTASIQEMSTSIGQVADNVQFLTRRSEEAMAALHEVERMIEKVSHGSEQTAVITGEVAKDAETGSKAVQTTIRGIDKIQETSRSVAEVITILGERAKEIGNILNVINDVTEETNLLALNAAIIAAQAGEHGRGFSVVADEIKDLAERTAASTSEIAELIESVQEDAATAVQRTRAGLGSITEGVRLAGDAGAALRQIVLSVNKAMKQTQDIAAAVTVQTSKARQLLEFMDGVNALISQVAAATSEQRKSGQQILAASEQMKEITQQVKRATTEQSQGSRQITQAIEHIAEITGFINSAQRDQLKSTDSVRAAVRRIQDVADHNQTRVAAMTSSMTELKTLAHDLQKLIDEFQV